MPRRWLQFSIRSLFVTMLVCAVATHFWPWRQGDGPDPKWREMFEGYEPLDNIPEITLLTTDDSGTHVTVKNVGKTTLEYYGTSSGHVQVFQECSEAGRWSLASWDWCGTGKELFEIAPNNSTELVVSFRNAQKCERMLASFSEKGTKRTGLVVLATEPRIDSK